MNEHEISFHVNSKSELQIVQTEKSCKSYEKSFFLILQYSQENMCWSLFLIKLEAFSS